MAYEERPNGAMFSNRQKQGQQPDWRGTMTFTPDLVRHLVELAKAGGEIKVEMAAWNKASEKAGTWLSVTMSPQRSAKQADKPTYAPRSPSPAPQRQATQPARRPVDDLDDEIPF